MFAEQSPFDVLSGVTLIIAVMFLFPQQTFLIVTYGRNLTHWGRVTHICVGNLTIIGSHIGLSPGRRQTIIWTNDGIVLIGPLGTNYSEISIKILTYSFTKIRSKVSSGKRRPSCLGLNVLRIAFVLWWWNIASLYDARHPTDRRHWSSAIRAT